MQLLQGGDISRLQIFANVQAPTLARPPDCTHQRTLSPARRPGRLHHATSWFVTCPGRGIASHPTRATGAAGLAPAELQPCRLLTNPVTPRPVISCTKSRASPSGFHLIRVQGATGVSVLALRTGARVWRQCWRGCVAGSSANRKSSYPVGRQSATSSLPAAALTEPDRTLTPDPSHTEVQAVKGECSMRTRVNLSRNDVRATPLSESSFT
jgi:hypothetical protein